MSEADEMVVELHRIADRLFGRETPLDEGRYIWYLDEDGNVVVRDQIAGGFRIWRK